MRPIVILFIFLLLSTTAVSAACIPGEGGCICTCEGDCTADEELAPSTFLHVQSEPGTPAVWDHWATYFDVLISHPYTYEFSRAVIADLRTTNPDITLLRYRASNVMFDVVSTDIDDAYDWSLDFMKRQNTEQEWLDVWTNHQDWFLRDASGNYIRIKQGVPVQYRGYMMDPANPEFRLWLARKLQQYIDYGYDGIHVDIATAKIWEGWDDRPVKPGTNRLYTDAEWVTAMTGLLNVLKQQLGNAVIIHNGLNTGKEYYATDGQQLASSLVDGSYVEGFTRWPRDPVTQSRSTDDWKKDVDMLKEISTLGKKAFVSTGMTLPNIRKEQQDQVLMYSLGTFLLVKDSNAVYRYNGKNYPDQSNWRDISIYTVKLGAPKADYFLSGNYGVYQRKFEYGKVMVNPTTGTVVMPLEKPYYRVLDPDTLTTEYLPSTITLGPNQASILLLPGECGCPSTQDLLAAISSWKQDTLDTLDLLNLIKEWKSC